MIKVCNVQEVIKVVLEKLPAAHQTPSTPSIKDISQEVLNALILLEAQLIPTTQDIKNIAKGTIDKLPISTQKQIKEMKKALKDITCLEGIEKAMISVHKFKKKFSEATNQSQRNAILLTLLPASFQNTQSV